MLFCQVTGVGGRGTVNRADVPRRRSPRPGCARTPGPRELSSLPRLRLVQNGARRERAAAGQPPTRRRLPITPAILRQMRPPATRRPVTASYQETMLWAAATVCFFGFFRAGEITVPRSSAFDARVHLCWGDVAIADTGGVLRVFLKRSKTDQFGRGAEVFGTLLV